MMKFYSTFVDLTVKWNEIALNEPYKFIDNEKIKRVEIVVILYLFAIVIQNGMKRLGVSLPKKM